LPPRVSADLDAINEPRVFQLLEYAGVLVARYQPRQPSRGHGKTAVVGPVIELGNLDIAAALQRGEAMPGIRLEQPMMQGQEAASAAPLVPFPGNLPSGQLFGFEKVDSLAIRPLNVVGYRLPAS
jgi:hypothetical protein